MAKALLFVSSAVPSAATTLRRSDFLSTTRGTAQKPPSTLISHRTTLHAVSCRCGPNSSRGGEGRPRTAAAAVAALAALALATAPGAGAASIPTLQDPTPTPHAHAQAQEHAQVPAQSPAQGQARALAQAQAQVPTFADPHRSREGTARAERPPFPNKPAPLFQPSGALPGSNVDGDFGSNNEGGDGRHGGNGMMGSDEGHRLRARWELRSGASLVETLVMFSNKSDGVVDLWWIDYCGAEVFYGSVFPGTTYVQPSFASHPWVVREHVSQNEVLMLVATDRPQMAVVNSL